MMFIFVGSLVEGKWLFTVTDLERSLLRRSTSPHPAELEPSVTRTPSPRASREHKTRAAHDHSLRERRQFVSFAARVNIRELSSVHSDVSGWHLIRRFARNATLGTSLQFRAGIELPASRSRRILRTAQDSLNVD